MFFPTTLPPTDEEKPVQGTSKPQGKSRKKKKRKSSIAKKKNKFGCAMSSWAENFAFAATWQLKHQLAFWKARAKSLEYENTILHEIIRKNCLDVPVTSIKPRKFDLQNSLSSNQDTESDKSETEVDQEESCPEEESQEEEFEVSEEFIQFLTKNAKYKEEARQEREKLKAKMARNDIIEELEAGPSKPQKSNSEELKELYGANWQRIAALEMSVQSQYISECDKRKPVYWPNIPFNFNS